MIKIIDTLTPAEWNKHATHPMQSYEWGEARKKMGIELLRLGEYNHADLKNVFQMTVHSIPYSPYKIGYLPRSSAPSHEVLESLETYARSHKIIVIKIEPHSSAESFTKPENKQLIPSPTPLFPEWTQKLDLSPREGELLSNMKPKTRYNIRLAAKKGVVIKEMTTKEGFDIFYQLYEQTCRRQHYFGHNRHYHEVIFQTLANYAHILIAWYEEKPLAAYELFLFNDVLYYPYGGSSDLHRDTMAANLLMWEAIRFGKQHNAHYFDMWGSLAPDYNHDNVWAGFTRFKEGYGTSFFKTAGSYDLVINPVLYWIYTTAQRLREKYMLFN
jgi:lipid II:glycine glycyltransferase (peptidoglycan interpeptide bridge formation enzyme)